MFIHPLQLSSQPEKAKSSVGMITFSEEKPYLAAPIKVIRLAQYRQKLRIVKAVYIL